MQRANANRLLVGRAADTVPDCVALDLEGNTTSRIIAFAKSIAVTVLGAGKGFTPRHPLVGVLEKHCPHPTRVSRGIALARTAFVAAVVLLSQELVKVQLTRGFGQRVGRPVAITGQGQLVAR